MQIGYLLYIDLIIFIAMAYSVIHYFSSSNRSTSINLSSYFKFSLYVLFTITLLDHFFLRSFFPVKEPSCMYGFNYTVFNFTDITPIFIFSYYIGFIKKNSSAEAPSFFNTHNISGISLFNAFNCDTIF